MTPRDLESLFQVLLLTVTVCVRGEVSQKPFLDAYSVVNWPFWTDLSCNKLCLYRFKLAAAQTPSVR